MARPKTDEFWVDRTRFIMANNPKLSGVAIRRRLVEIHKREAPTSGPPPSERAIRRIKEQFKEMPDIERKKFEYFTWPEAMQAGALPWEASKACLEVLAYLRSHMPTPAPPPEIFSDRPRIDFLESYWNVTQAAPSAPIPIRLLIAASLVTAAVSGTQEIRRAEGCLLYAPWESEANANAYAAAVADEKIPPFAKATRPLADPRMFLLIRMVGTDDIRDVENSWIWLSDLCRRAIGLEVPIREEKHILVKTAHGIEPSILKTVRAQTPPKKRETKKGIKNGKNKTDR